MLALKIIDVKDFMNQLLIRETFDRFELLEASITTFNTFSIDGKLQADFFDTDTKDMLTRTSRNYSLWKEVKPYCFSIIRGKHTPLHFKIIFQLPAGQVRSFSEGGKSSFSAEQIRGVYLNLQYKDQILMCTTGVSLNTFLPDKTPEHLWDASVLEFFRKHHLIFETL
jgi:hypothetical protein